jgi:outer membrane protein assembly factor BamB
MIVVALAVSVARGAEPAEQGFWPQWRGPDRTNVARDTGLLKAWPEGGPPLLWKAEGLGEGVPSVAVAGGKVFVLGYRDDKEFLTAVNENDGTRAWSVSVGPAVKEMSIMRWLSQRTPTVDGDRVYAFTARGQLICLATGDGKELWRKDYIKDFGGRPGNWGYCDFPLVDGDRLIGTPGAANATLVALNKKTGEVIWKCALPGNSRNTYGGVVAATIGGVRQYVHQLDMGIVGVAASDGKILWQFPDIRSEMGNVHTAIVRGSEVFASCGWGVGAALLKLLPDGSAFRAEALYKVKSSAVLESWRGSSMAVGDFVLTVNGGCLEWKTGKLIGYDRSLGAGTATFADQRLYHRTGQNKVTLCEISDKGTFIRHGSFSPPRLPKPPTNEPAWTFPVVAGGRLYLRDHDWLLCYDVRDTKRRRRGPDVIFVPTPQDVVEKMLELAAVIKGDVVADLGCGDGRIVTTAAKKYRCRAIGYDIDPECVRLSREKVKENGVQELVTVERKDIFDVDLKDVSVVMLYLGSVMNAKLIPQLERMKPGSRIVSHAFDMPGVKPDKVIEVVSEEDDIRRKIYLWTIPLKKDMR